MLDFVTVILAAGKGTRMKSKLPKVLHRAAGKSMLQHVIDAAYAAGARRNIVVTGFGGDVVRTAIGDSVEYVEQCEQLGTGHAVLQAKDLLSGEHGTIMVLCGDTPLLTAELLARFHEEHVNAGAKATVLTAIMPNAKGYGRIIRRENGEVLKIVEHKDATPEEREIHEVNAGIYCFDAEALFSALTKVTNDNAQGEYYLPDVLSILRDAGEKIWAVVADNYESTLGINSRSQLAVAERILRKRKVEELMADGVTIMDPNTTFIDAEVRVGMDTIIYPFTILEGVTVIGEDCIIGPHVRFQDMVIGDGVKAHYVYAHDAEVESGSDLGQFNHIRPDSHIGTGVKIGNFVEIKNSNIGECSKVPHLSYIGDCDMGAHVNMGCGTITVNYDGKNKYRTSIGNDAFVGCNSNLVAPVVVGENAYVAAGSTITRDVPSGTLAVARARQKEIEGWHDKRK
ncbi:UDP-N-acetylglucosamine diphosphorylase/glucosamine-1-phosphate N-acetyltransferase [Selenomonas sp. oral taxon 892 str. F0426]|jgi:UDP-N-acetylglucosamine diphosphorylase/glucosamine-1-phosphate N-acetyltransferase|uniref:bifunctional UDP-N-acetylglucosamine diphosphorylase/glucosamine-1-phosphate N-acetyltransferase GlmU n=1 Tax=Selenomonas sp. oral taxon 892 TaxID=1321785 RepID=UPI0003AD3A09|nr:bifunctional UDP-N-acetylglucosamine diphosphorylase/glucosamine-1-phosphate N-acetyltransferase GlmU [Selenomonas sp. oral taxon 892]ERJ92766.1 UDP-N-acetylglucosamine diphosphorylase/glucosamine-1-phosphate N-acetyltransferase [Selenomonas sp. oral taxon 892 str. F0426]